jgi:very-short-patch-repair endonuclease
MKRAGQELPEHTEAPQKRQKLAADDDDDDLPKASRKLTKAEEYNLRVARDMFDHERNPGVVFKQLNPLAKVLYWFKCVKHNCSFEKKMYNMVKGGYIHVPCKETRLTDVAPHLKDYFVSAPNKKAFEDLTHASHEECTWRCKKKHEFQVRVKEILKRKKFVCKTCYMGSHSMKAKHPELERFFIKGEKDPSYSDISAQSHKVYTWWCDKELHKIERTPKGYFHAKEHECKECDLIWKSSMDNLYPQLKPRFSPKNDAKFGSIDIDSKVIYTWHCREKLHEIQKTPREFVELSKGRCKHCYPWLNSAPDMEKYYCQDNTAPFSDVYFSNEPRYWWCKEFKHKKLKRPDEIFPRQARKCFECRLLSVQNPALYAQLDHEKNKEAKIDTSILTYGCNTAAYWKCPIDDTHPSWLAKITVRSLGLRHCALCKPKQSIVENTFEQLLKDRGIDFEKQKRDLIGLKYKNALSCDFYIAPNLVSTAAVLIEVDGAHHFLKGIYKDVEVPKRDRKKNIYAKSHGINMLRVDYRSKARHGEILDQFLKDIYESEDPLPPFFIGPSYTDDYKNTAFDDPPLDD